MKEIWKDIKGFEGIYQVSSSGLVRSRYSKSGKSLCDEYHRLKLLKTTNGYLKVLIGRKNKTVHRLVAETFIENKNNCKQVNHINGNKQDNRVENLEWVSAKDNINHAVKNGLIKSRGIIMKNEKTGEEIVFISRKDIEKYLNRKVSQDLITRCCNKQRKTAYGMKWNYIMVK